MIYEGIYEKHKDEIKVVLIMFVGFFLSTIIEVILGLSFDKTSMKWYVIITFFLKISCVLLVGFITNSSKRNQ